jgi:hypothetical protein
VAQLNPREFNMVNQRYYLVLSILCCVSNSLAHSNGADTLACLNLSPIHGSYSPQASTAPAQIVIGSGSIQSNQLVDISLRANPGTSFRGFVVQARRTGIANPQQSGKVLKCEINEREINKF